MKRILILYYSQSGDVARATEALVAPLERGGADVVWKRIEPVTPYPYPWKTADRFFGVFPECVVGDAPPIQPLNLAGERFDLIVFAWQVWFLSPSLPVQGFFRSPDAQVLQDTPVVTLAVSRNMRHVAGRRMRKQLQAAGAIHVGEVAATHQGPALATFVTTPRALFTGKRDRLWGVMPPAGIGDSTFQALQQTGETLAERSMTGNVDQAPRLGDEGQASSANWGYRVAESAGWPLFVFWAHAVRFLGRFGSGWRMAGLRGAILSLIFALLVLIPLGLLLAPLVYACSRLRRSRTSERHSSCGPFSGSPLVVKI